jgi:hypothetical protein
VLLVLAGIIYVTSTIAFVISRRPEETSAQAMERQMIEHQKKAP